MKMRATLAFFIWLTATGTAFAGGGLLQEARKHFKPLPSEPSISATAERVDLGSKLFFDPRFSADGTVSCVRCHQPGLFGTDALSTSIGVKGSGS